MSALAKWALAYGLLFAIEFSFTCGLLWFYGGGWYVLDPYQKTTIITLVGIAVCLSLKD